ncbi:hypothetical protein QE152_g14061 [Popillia japonica]|uniref:Uncharacterized protein n=1 Tax=Popillia japonica TaxID=7064 RepID=A0AAW1LAI3_POPJA
MQRILKVPAENWVNDDNVNSTNDVKINKEQQDEINEMREDLGKRIKRKPIWHNDYDMSNLANQRNERRFRKANQTKTNMA